MKKIINNNPIFGYALGLCPVLALSKNFESSLIMGVLVVLILLITSFIVSLLKKLIKKDIELITLVIVIATIVTVSEILVSYFLPKVSSNLGIYLPILTVNCLILGRSLTIYMHEKVSKSLLDAIKTGFGFLFGICLVALIREILGNNSLTLINELSSVLNFKLVISNIIPPNNLLPNPLFLTSAGAFLTIAFIVAIGNFINKKERYNESI